MIDHQQINRDRVQAVAKEKRKFYLMLVAIFLITFGVALA
jgi:hypothetical protein